MYQQLIQPNLNIVGQNGLCLVYVREVFGAPAKYPTAINAWQNAIQHSGEPPANAVPIWFNWQTDGHVAVWDNGTIYSTTAQGDKTFSSIPELESYIGGGIAYLGWSEDINSVRIVEEEMFNEGDAVNFNNYVYGKDNGQFRGEVGQDWKTAAYNIMEQLQGDNQLLVNSGDVSNMTNAGIANAGENVGLDWKYYAYNTILPGLPTTLNKTNVEAYISEHLS